MHVGLSHLIGGIVAIIFLVGGAFTVGTKWVEPEANTASASEAVKEGTATSSEAIAEAEPGEELFDVIKVIDGDTVAVSMRGKSETIRLIGIDTPETNDPRTGVQCFGKEAAEKLKSVIGKRVMIERDGQEGERDKYDRLLAYIYTEEGLFLNKYLIEQGYAYEYTYDDPYAYQKEFKAAQADAKAKKRGLWAPDACPKLKKTAPAAVKTVAPTSAPTLEPMLQPQPQPQAQIQPQPTPAPAPQPQPEPKKEEPRVEVPPTIPSSSSTYTCSSNTYNCTDFSTHSEAQAVFDQCGGVSNDVHKLDSNKDGEACESLP